MKGAGSIVSMDDSATVEDLSRGLDWAQWLLRSVRQRCAGVLLPEASSAAELKKRWGPWLEGRFVPDLGPCLLDAWESAGERDAQTLMDCANEWAGMLSTEERTRSLRAGHQLLRSLRGAKHTGLLSMLQESAHDEEWAGHVGIVWPVVATVFQVSPSIMLAEYLRMEVKCSARLLPELHEEAYVPAMLKAVQASLHRHHRVWNEAQQVMD